MIGFSSEFLKILGVSGLWALIVAGIGGFLTETGPWYRSLRNPAWKPPDWAFGPVWMIILGCAAFSAAYAWEAVPSLDVKTNILMVFGINGILNILWNVLFFSFRRPDWAFYEVVFLWLSVLAVILVIVPFSTSAALLMVPYLVWVAIAALLNFRVVQLNRPFWAG
jgi:tryptophan-rich sensory protein